jgi:predicted alpha/beta hydrolase family esterase
MHKILFLHGWTNRRPEGHWMRLSAAELRAQGHHVWYPQFPDPDSPKPFEWQDLLRQESNMMDEAPGDQKICIAHSLGTINWLYGALGDLFNKPFDRVLLVAPPDPQMTSDADGIEGEPLNLANPALAPQARKWGTQLTAIAGDNDRWLPRGVGIYEPALGIKPMIFAGAGHFSLDDGWGPWPGLTNWIKTANSEDLLER